MESLAIRASLCAVVLAGLTSSLPNPDAVDFPIEESREAELEQSPHDASRSADVDPATAKLLASAMETLGDKNCSVKNLKGCCSYCENGIIGICRRCGTCAIKPTAEGCGRCPPQLISLCGLCRDHCSHQWSLRRNLLPAVIFVANTVTVGEICSRRWCMRRLLHLSVISSANTVLAHNVAMDFRSFSDRLLIFFFMGIFFIYGDFENRLFQTQRKVLAAAFKTVIVLFFIIAMKTALCC